MLKKLPNFPKKLYKQLHGKLQKRLQKKLQEKRCKKLHTKVYPCLQADSAAPLVLLPGWSFDSRLWQDLIEPLQRYTQVITLDLPGFGDNRWASWRGQEDICRQIVRVMPPRALYAGWSLGGMLATRIAADFPDRVMGIITLAANASFIERRSWTHGMSGAEFQTFYNAIDTDMGRTLKRFHVLLAQGDQLNSQQLKWLRTVAAQPADYNSLLPALSLLKDIDNRGPMHRLQAPGLHIFGDRDHLVPSSAVQALAALSAQSTKQRTIHRRQHYHLLNNVGHLVFWPHTRVMPLIKTFINGLQT